MTLDYHASINEHIFNITGTRHVKILRQTSIRRFLTNTSIARLVSAFVSSKTDYCSSLPFGYTYVMTSHL